MHDIKIRHSGLKMRDQKMKHKKQDMKMQDWKMRDMLVWKADRRI